MKYYEITDKSRAYVAVSDYWVMKGKWVSEIKNGELGVFLREKFGTTHIATTVDYLILGDKPPESMEKFFTCDNGGYRAKKSSKLYKEYHALTQKLGLKNFSYVDIGVALGTCWHRGKETHYPPMNGKYYFETNRTVEELEGINELSETDFLRLRLNQIQGAK